MSNLAEGILRKFWGKAESTYNTDAAFAATDAMGLLDLKLEPEMAEELSAEAVGTASLQHIFSGPRRGKWSASSYMRPAAAGTAPDIGELLKAALGAETVVGATSVTYGLSDSVHPSLQLARQVGLGMWERANGAWIEQLDVESQSGQAPRISVQGGYASHTWAYGTTVGTGGASIGATSVPVASPFGQLAVGAYLKIGTNENTGAGHHVTAVNASTGALTISPALTAAVIEGDAIVPIALSQTLGGSLIASVNHGFTVDSVALGLIGFKLSVKTGLKGLDKEITSDLPTRVGRGDRLITGELQFYFIDSANSYLAGRAWDGTTHALALRFGRDVAASRCKVTIPKARLKVSPIEVAEKEEATFTMQFTAMQSAAACDELTIAFD